MSLITARNLAVGYESHAVADGITFTVSEGDYLCIVGENGAGKSTLMKTLLRLQDPLDGELSFDDSLKQRGIGYLPQQTDIQKDFPASVAEVVLSGRQGAKGLSPFYNKEDRAIADKNISKMGIESLKRRCYRDLSGGQQQRVLLARALCAASIIMLLDEPAAGLDPVATEDMYRTIADLHKGGMTVIMITHDIAAAMKYATSILMLGAETFFADRDGFMTSEAGKRFRGEGGAAHA